MRREEVKKGTLKEGRERERDKGVLMRMGEKTYIGKRRPIIAPQ